MMRNRRFNIIMLLEDLILVGPNELRTAVWQFVVQVFYRGCVVNPQVDLATGEVKVGGCVTL